MAKDVVLLVAITVLACMVLRMHADMQNLSQQLAESRVAQARIAEQLEQLAARVCIKARHVKKQIQADPIEYEYGFV
eukprot:22686-Eustigmatos_ZCMA.PRE.1